MASFQTVEETEEGAPLVSGLFMDVGAEVDKEAEITKVIRKMQALDKDFKPPFIVMDLSTAENVAIRGDASYDANTDDTYVSEDYEQNPSVKLLVPCSQVVDLTKIGGIAGSTKIVKCNSMVPVYRWFQAANLMLHFADKTGRLIQFPLDHEQGTTYHMLPVNPSEFQLYQQILDFGTQTEGMEKGFSASGRFAYELLRKRGISEISADQVDALIAHVMVGHMGGVTKGILLHRASREDLEELKESHFVYY